MSGWQYVRLSLVNTTAHRIDARLPVAVVRNKQIEPAVVVVVNPCRRHRPQLAALRVCASNAGGRGHVGEGAIAVVPVERVAVHAHNVQILQPIVVVVAHCDAHLVAAPLHARARCHIRKGAVAVVTVEAIPEAGIALFERGQRRAVHAIEVGPSIVVEIDDAEAAGQRLHLILAAECAIAQYEIKAIARRGIHKTNGTSRCSVGETSRKMSGETNPARHPSCEIAAGQCRATFSSPPRCALL